MPRDQDRDLRALRTALRRLAAEDLDGVLEEARAGARVEARRILEDHLVEELLREAAARSPDSRTRSSLGSGSCTATPT